MADNKMQSYRDWPQPCKDCGATIIEGRGPDFEMLVVDRIAVENGPWTFTPLETDPVRGVSVEVDELGRPVFTKSTTNKNGFKPHVCS